MRALFLLTLLVSACLAAPCRAACDAPLEASFSHDLSDGRHVTITSVIVPAPIAEAEAVLTDVAAYPRWLFTGPDGAPTLHEVRWNRDDSTFSAVIGAAGKGLPLTGHLDVSQGEHGTILRASGADANIKSWSFELAARPHGACAERTLLSLRMELVFSLKARVFGGTGKSMPLLLALAARDDLAAVFVTRAERLSALVPGASLTTLPSGRPAISLEGAPEAEILSCRPHALAVGPARAAAFGAMLARLENAKRPDLGELLDAAAEAISGRHAIATWQLRVSGRDRAVVLAAAPASVHATASVTPEEKGFSLAFGAGAKP